MRELMTVGAARRPVEVRPGAEHAAAGTRPRADEEASDAPARGVPLQSSPAAPSLHWGSILHCIRNTGLAIADAIPAGDACAIALLNTLCQWRELSTMRNSAGPQDQKAIDLITGLAEHVSSRS